MSIEIRTTEDLKSAIRELEGLQKIQAKILKDEIHEKWQSLKPLNLLKRTVSNAISGSSAKTNLVRAGIGMGVGLLTKRLIGGPVNSLLKNAAINGLKFAASALVARKAEGIAVKGKNLLSRIFS